MRFSLLVALCLSGAATAAERLPLIVGGQSIQVELAATPAARQRGLMGRTHLAPDTGMLFVFDAPGRHCFWMRDTPLPPAEAQPPRARKASSGAASWSKWISTASPPS